MVRQIVVVAEDPDQLVDAIIVWSEVRVCDRPIVTKPIAALRLEILGAESKRDASPVIGAATDHSSPPPLEVGALGVGERLALDVPPADTGVKFAEWMIRRRRSSERRFVRPFEHDRVFEVVPRATGLEQEHVGARTREHVGSHSTTGARPYDTNVVRLPLWQWERRGRAQSHCKSAVEDTRNYDPPWKGTRARRYHVCVAETKCLPSILTAVFASET